MAITLAKLQAIITADTSALDRALVKADRDLSTFVSRGEARARRMEAVGAALSIGLTAPLVALAGRGVKLAADFEGSMGILQQASGATTRQMRELGEQARRLGGDITLPATSSVTAAKAMTELARAGLSVNATMAASRGVLQLAAAASIDAAQAATITADALNAFRLRGEEATRVADALAATANASTGDITDFAQGLQQTALVAASARLSLTETLTTLGLFANSGLKGADAGTSLKTAIIALTAPTDEAAAKMRELGIFVTDAQGKVRPFRDVVDNLSRATRNLSDEQRSAALKVIFGSDAIRTATVLAQGGVKAFDAMAGKVEAQGAAADAAAAKNRGLKGALDGFQGAVDSFLESHASKFLGFFTEAVNGASALIGKLDELSPATKALAGGGLLAAVGVGPGLNLAASATTAAVNYRQLRGAAGAASVAADAARQSADYQRLLAEALRGQFRGPSPGFPTGVRVVSDAPVDLTAVASAAAQANAQVKTYGAAAATAAPKVGLLTAATTGLRTAGASLVAVALNPMTIALVAIGAAAAGAIYYIDQLSKGADKGIADAGKTAWQTVSEQAQADYARVREMRAKLADEEAKQAKIDADLAAGKPSTDAGTRAYRERAIARLRVEMEGLKQAADEKQRFAEKLHAQDLASEKRRQDRARDAAQKAAIEATRKQRETERAAAAKAARERAAQEQGDQFGSFAGEVRSLRARLAEMQGDALAPLRAKYDRLSFGSGPVAALAAEYVKLTDSIKALEATKAAREQFASSIQDLRDRVLMLRDSSVRNEQAVRIYHRAYKDLTDEQRAAIAPIIALATEERRLQGVLDASKKAAEDRKRAKEQAREAANKAADEAAQRVTDAAKAVRDSRLAYLEASAATDAHRVAIRQFGDELENLPWMLQVAAAAIAGWDAKTRDLDAIKARSEELGRLRREYQALTMVGSEWDRFVMAQVGKSASALSDDETKALRDLFDASRNREQADGLARAQDALRGMAGDLRDTSKMTAEARLAWRYWGRELSELAPEIQQRIRDMVPVAEAIRKAEQFRAVAIRVSSDVGQVVGQALEATLTRGADLFGGIVQGFRAMLARLVAEWAANEVARRVLKLFDRDYTGLANEAGKASRDMISGAVAIGVAAAALSKSAKETASAANSMMAASITSSLAASGAGGAGGLGAMAAGGKAGLILAGGLLADKLLFKGAISKGVGKLFGGLFAEGGRPPLGRASLVGEEGPELFVPDGAGTVIPADQTRSILGGGRGDVYLAQGGTVVVNDAADVVRIQSIVRARRQDKLRLMGA